MLLEMQRRQRGSSAVAEAARADTVATVAAVDYRAGSNNRAEKECGERPSPPRRPHVLHERGLVTIALFHIGRSGKPQHPFDRRASGDCNMQRAALAAGERTAVGAGRTGAETPRCVWLAAS